jgi:hypothetical protein
MGRMRLWRESWVGGCRRWLMRGLRYGVGYVGWAEK